MSEDAGRAWAQLIGLGVLWISVHCAGMCGPLLIGLDVAGVGRGSTAGKGARSILIYQAGRALTYAFFGALMGLLGAGLGEVYRHAGGFLTVAIGALFLATGIRPLWPRRTAEADSEAQADLGPEVTFGRRQAKASGWDRLTGLFGRLQRLVASLGGGQDSMHTFALGIVMGLLPCMITIWVLGLAATTGSALHGAGLGVVLVAMTTPMLLGVTLLPRLATKRLKRIGDRLPAILTTVSGAWLTMAGLAGLEWIPHLHFHLDVAGRTWALMLW